MNLANVVTFSRVVFSPIFFVVFFIPEWTGQFKTASVLVFWVLFLLIELSDLFDGMVARAMNQVSDLGKLLDPFADVISRITYFVCLAGIGIMPIWVLMIILYREFSVSFIRLMMLKKGIAMAARLGGKLKAWAYAFAGIAGLLLVSIQRTGFYSEYEVGLSKVSFALFVIAAISAVISFTDYYIVLIKQGKK